MESIEQPIKKKRGRPPKETPVETIVVQKPVKKVKVFDDLAVPLEPLPPLPSPPASPAPQDESDEDTVMIENYINDLVDQKVTQRMRSIKQQPIAKQSKVKQTKTAGFNPAYLLPVLLPLVKFGAEALVRYGPLLINQPAQAIKKPISQPSGFLDGVV